MAFPSHRLVFALFLSVLNLQGAALSLDEAIALLKAQNLEIKAAALDAKNAHNDLRIAQGYNFGSLDFTQTALRSNDAGNVFGFKLSSRQATFGDFGFSEFLAPMGQALLGANAQALTPASIQGMNSILAIQPKDLNYPGYQNYFQSKLTYMLPIYTGGKLSGYSKIAREMEKIKQLDATKVTAEKIYETRKSYYDMALLQHSLEQMTVIQKNMEKLHAKTKEMVAEGYAKKVDLLEIEAKKANVDRMVLEMGSNKKLLLHYISFLLNQKTDEIAIPKDDKAITTADEASVMSNNTDLKKASHGLAVRSSMVDVAMAPFLPTLGVFGEASSANDTLMRNIHAHAAYTVGAKLSWNLFNGAVDAHNFEKARIDRLKTATEVEMAKKGIALQYDKLHTEIENLDEQIVSLEKERALAAAITKNYEGRYHEHLVSMSDLIIKQSNEIEKIMTLQSVKNQRNERIFALEKLNYGANQ